MVNNKISISIVIPTYNEIGNIQQFHHRLLKTMATCRSAYEIIYVDDYSTDGTFEWLESVALESTVRIFRKSGNKGKAYSLLQGFRNATGDIFIMIDGDLQYPPESIPEMVQELENADIIVADRKEYHDGSLRKVLSSGFKNIFGKILFGLKTDIQSGLKVFKKDVYHIAKTQPSSPWTFDLEFLSRAYQAGFIIKNIPIIFSARENGRSKVNIFAQTLEIGLNALYIKLKRTFYFDIYPEDETMRGAGVSYKKKKYITHTTLTPMHSAIRTFSLLQKIILLGTPIILLLLLYLFPLPTARMVIAILSILYFIDALFNIFVVLRSLNKDHEITIDDESIQSLDEKNLPVYSILCPLYKESHIVPQFLEGIAKIDWPKEKLDVMFLLEEDDIETIHAFNQIVLPYYARTVIVPDSQPKTKPKACNYGLSYAKGKYLVIYDAEDLPDPLQLKKAFLAFQKLPKNVKCLQAKLSYYNSRQNLLTRFFTAEYALWFDITLPGLQSLNSALPLGGTSNHFETSILKKLQGWDPFNVTEDADLGVRLFQKGYRTAIIDSTTYEEATSITKNWLRQRSRWIKGYMQTYLVHMRNIVPFVKSNGLWHNAIFQFTVGGKIMFALLNPFMWIITILYFIAFPIVGPVMLAIYQPPFSYLAVCSWIFGNFLFLYSYMIAVGKRKQWDITKYVLLIPIYWLMMSTAAAIALYQLILKPHYWEKTIHGFHLGKKKSIGVTQPAYKPMPQPIFQPALEPAIDQVQVQVNMPDFQFFNANMHINKLQKMITPIIVLTSKVNMQTFILRWLPLFALLNMDMLLARYFLSYEDAQLYILVSFIGKTVFLVSQFGSNILTAYVSKNKLSLAYLYRLIFFTFLLNWIGFVAFGLEGNYLIPVVFSKKFAVVIPYTSYYLFGVMCFSIAYRLTTFSFYKKNYSYTFVTLAAILLQIPFIFFHHDTVDQIILSFAYIGSLNLIFLIMLELSVGLKRVMENNIASFLSLFERRLLTEGVESNMRILIFNWRDMHHKFAGGAEVYVHELAERWVKDGNLVTLFCGNDNKHARYEIINGVEIYRRGGNYTVYLFGFIYYILKFRGKYDVIIDCENGVPFFTPLYAKEQVILLIHHVHQEIFYIFLKFPFNMIAAFMEGKLMPIIYRNKDVVTVSPSSQKDILNLGFTKEKNIQIIPNGVSEMHFVDYPKTDHPSYIYLGRLKEYKKIDIAIKAFAKIIRIKKDATLAIVGSGESYYKLKKLVISLGIEHAVTFHGRVTEQEKSFMLAKSWVAIQPSQMEGWGITVIEANAAGTPVIASRVNGLQDSVINNQTGILVPAGDVTGFANAMMLLSEDHSLRMSLSQQAREWARNFDWNKSSEVFSNLIGKSFAQESLNRSYADVIFSVVEKSFSNI
ncbi:MAG TPA: glycosyltransferase [Candidatus Sulfotelmatobacter sp.]|jgi:cellulose synthase/poly-beta-1,6-N-acetylglucosamine synthase-like glycosyltransferase/glycosyltransferase involved in cell wall biosynthesis|nr:glycosyltransferase [Candidatus Sulfotelmatobacter sp.]